MNLKFEISNLRFHALYLLVQFAAPCLALYVLLNPFRVFVTVNVPSLCADTLTQYAVPLCCGGGGTFGPGVGGVIAAIGMVSG